MIPEVKGLQPIFDRELVRSQVEWGRSTYEVAKVVGCSPSLVKTLMNRHGWVRGDNRVCTKCGTRYHSTRTRSRYCDPCKDGK